MPLTERPEPKQKKQRQSAPGRLLTSSPGPLTGQRLIAGFEWTVFLIVVVTGQSFPMLIGGLFGVAWTLLTVKRVHR